MAAAADEHEAEAAYVHDDRLLGDRTEPEHHLRQRRQEGDARGDRARPRRENDLGALMTHRRRDMGGQSLRLQRFGCERKRSVTHAAASPDVVGMHMRDNDPVQTLEVGVEGVGVLHEGRPYLTASIQPRVEKQCCLPCSQQVRDARLAK